MCNYRDSKMPDTLYGFPTPLGIISNETALIGLGLIGIFVVVTLIIKSKKDNK
jgi:hypothetical protein